MLEATDLRKSYAGVVALDGVSFTVGAGECVGLLGPNGAGKTTTLAIVAGLLAADSGRVVLDGQELRGDGHAAKRRLGLVPQDLALYDDLTARENLALFGALYGLSGRPLAAAMDRALELVGLTDRARDRVATF